MSTTVRRKLTTILAADAVGYSKAMDADEIATLDALHAARAVFSRFIDRHEGRLVNTAGDGLIAEFASVVEAVQCAIEVQSELADPDHHSNNSLSFRIGIHLGDVMIDGDDLLGEGVNLASRLETMAEAGGILISQQVYDQVQHKLSVGFDYLGEKRPKNLSTDIPVYRLALGKKRRRRFHPSLAKSVTREPVKADYVSTNLKEQISRLFKILVTIWIALLVIDLTTGSPFWSHWPGLVLGTWLALKAIPLFTPGWINIQYGRLIVIVCALCVVNALTWTGYPWVLWPAGALIVLSVIRNISVNKT